MVNLREPLINIVNQIQAKDADRLGPKGQVAGCIPVVWIHMGIKATGG